MRQDRDHRIRRWTGAVLDLLFPPRCPFCDRLLKDREDGICRECQPRLPWTRPERDERHGEFVDRCISPLWYQGAVRDSFHRHKFDGCRDYAGVYAGLMAQCVGDRLAGEYDLLTYVPLSAKRRRQRGYDQVRLLAEGMAPALELPVTDTLEKTRHTAAQSGLTDDGARRANVLGAYRVRDPEAVRGRRVLLVDDVVTTGATLSECARVLRTAGAAAVVCVTFVQARAQGREETPEPDARRLLPGQEEIFLNSF